MKACRIIPLCALLLATTLTLSQTATQSAPAALTPQEREAALKQFAATRDNFLKSISGISEKQWTFKPAPDRWSVAEVAEHITVSETGIFGVVQKAMESQATPE